MLTIAWYLVKVIICSGILYGYYYAALRNKIFHQWNRFYLLAAVVLSLSVPFIKINIWQKPEQPATQVIQLLQVVTSGDEVVYNYTRSRCILHIDAITASTFIYVIISSVLFTILFLNVLKILRLRNKQNSIYVDGINLINTDAKGTPFSFFNYIFWNNKIDIESASGKQILKHELVHVKEKHSYDKIFINIVLIFCWCNPFFWFYRKELNTIHEFIADKKAVEDSDTAAFAAMILQSTFPTQSFLITNNFFYSPLKRRLAMLIKNKNPRISYISRILVLPFAALVFFAFTIKMKKIKSNAIHSDKKITVVIDAGHGGEDVGAKSLNGIYEKDITLSIAKKIKELNSDENIKLVFTREEDKLLNVRDRVNFATAKGADLFISVHVNAVGVDANPNANSYSGLMLFIPANNNGYLQKSKALGSAMIESFKNNYGLPINNNLNQRERGIWILNENTCPAIIIEPGYLTTASDEQYLTRKENIDQIAKNILAGIEKYVQQKIELVQLKNNDTIPPDKDASNKSKEQEIRLHDMGTPLPPLYILDGKKISISELNNLSPNSIKTIDVLKGESAIKKYGDKAKNGVVEIMTKKDELLGEIKPDTPPTTGTSKDVTVQLKENDRTPGNQNQANKIFTKVETEAQFPGGKEAWSKYITKIIREHIDELTDAKNSGTCRVRFIVYEDGSIADVTVLTMQGTKLAEVSTDAIRKGPKWIPATQNGHVVTSYKEVPITFTIQDQNISITINVGDHIFVLLRGESDLQIEYVVAKDGTISSPGIGKLKVEELNFEEARKLIFEKFAKVKPPGASVYVSLNQAFHYPYKKIT